MLRGGLLWGLALTLAACPAEHREDPNQRLCPSACASLERPACDRAASDASNCLASCRATRSQAERATCTREYDGFLGCLSASARVCPRGASVGELLSEGRGAEPCQVEYAAFARCARACREHGVVRTAARRLSQAGRERAVQAEVTTRGCGQSLPAARRGAPAGARCEHESVCDPVECACPVKSESYRVRACVDASCADPATACRLAPLAVTDAICRP